MLIWYHRSVQDLIITTKALNIERRAYSYLKWYELQPEQITFQSSWISYHCSDTFRGLSIKQGKTNLFPLFTPCLFLEFEIKTETLMTCFHVATGVLNQHPGRSNYQIGCKTLNDSTVSTDPKKRDTHTEYGCPMSSESEGLRVEWGWVGTDVAGWVDR